MMQKVIRYFFLACLCVELLGGETIAQGKAPAQKQANVNTTLFTKNVGETDTAFIDRIPPPKRPLFLKKKADDPDTIRYGEPSLVHGPIITKWNALPVIIVLYEVSVTEVRNMKTYVDHDQHNNVDGYVYASTGQPNRYKRIFMGSIEGEGGEPEIESVFFVNADHDAKKELAVLVKWEQLLHADYSGTMWGAFIYDDISSVSRDTLVFLPQITEKLGTSYQCQSRDGEPIGKYYYQTSGEVKERLKKLGF